jgi:glycosyltransferase involved in cell wall biosynthesis
MRALVTHPGMQHAHQLALALHEGGHLAGIWSGIPIANTMKKTHRLFRIFSFRPRQSSIPSELRRHFGAFPALRRVASNLGGPKLRNSIGHRLDHLFDRCVAKDVIHVRPDITVCYENSAMHTFRIAKSIGSLCVLDAASVHYQAAAEWHPSSVATDPAWVQRQKKLEIDLADVILTCSPLAGSTYTAAGVSRSKVYVCPLGTDLPSSAKTVRSGTDVRRFVFVGTLMRRKGVDLLLTAFERLYRNNVAATLTLIGGAGEYDLARRIASVPNVSYRPFMDQPHLFEEITKYDCLILPSRFDSFGMVVAEAMAVGVPVVVSDRVGAKCIIEEHPGAGWVVSCEADALYEKLLDLIKCPSMIVAASEAAMVAARDYTWDAYRRRVRRILEEAYEQVFQSKSDSELAKSHYASQGVITTAV